jgi:hypothetical protein
VAKVIKRVRAKDIKVHLDTTAVEFLIHKGYDSTYGARPMRRAVEKYLEDPLAEEFLRRNIKQGDTLEVHTAGEQLAFKVTQPKQSEPANGSPLRSRGLMQQHAGTKGAIPELVDPAEVALLAITVLNKIRVTATANNGTASRLSKRQRPSTATTRRSEVRPTQIHW